jgi:hypothetical protein
MKSFESFDHGPQKLAASMRPEVECLPEPTRRAPPFLMF